MNEWSYIVVGLCVLLLIFLLWKEIRRKNKSRLLWRIITTITGTACFACIALPVYYNTAEQVTINNKAILLTEGFNTDSVTNFIEANAGTPVLFFDKGIKGAEKYHAQYVADVSLLSQQYKDIQLFHVFGYGFNKEELNSLQEQALIFHPSRLPAGITAIHWQQNLHSGDKLVVQGTYNSIANAKAKIVLTGFGTVIDSSFIDAKEQERFSLTAIPKNIGRTTYTISVTANNDTVETETIPVQVEKGEPLKILMLASSPDFDNKFLKSELSQDGYMIAARTIISKDKFAYEYLNTSSFALDHITTSLLEKFDVTVADAAALTAIPKSELVILQSAVAQKGMGLIIKADSITPSSFYTAPFPINTAVSGNTYRVTTFLLDTAYKMPALITNYAASIRSQANTQPLVFDKERKVYASSTLYGSGRIVFTTLSNTYFWALSGAEDAYRKYWATLLNKAAAMPTAGEVWSISPSLPLVDAPVQLQLQTNTTGIPQGQINGIAVYLKNNPGLPYQWSGTYYPTKEGWQTIIGLNGKPFYWYAFNKTDWQNIYASEEINITKQHIDGNVYANNYTEIKPVVKEIDIPKVYFFIVLLICFGFLWLENKYLLSASK